MRWLIGCEVSGVVRRAMRKRGIDAYSCDTEPSEDGSRYHIQDDILRVIRHRRKWNRAIFFPPCTYLTVSGNRWFLEDESRYDLQEEALQFVWSLLTAPIEKIALENPVGVISTRIRKPDQIIHPWEYGHGVLKKTCLWLKEFPLLVPTNIVPKEERKPLIHHAAPGPNRQRERSRTFDGIGEAMADQWGGL